MTLNLPLLETKLYPPQWTEIAISRPRLLDRIQQNRKLTLISAPAGFGKTTLLAEWIQASPTKHVAWVSLDQNDNNPALFWNYLIAALQKVQANLGERAYALLNSPQPPPTETVLMTLLNELTAIEQRFVLILDDYHVIDTQTIHDGIGLLLNHLPTQVHLMIASRADPPLALARLRSCRELTELRASDLRFTPKEAAAFLNQGMGLAISADEVAALEQRTEGWIAGLQLAALSLQGRENISDFIAAFSGDDRYIVDYLLEEVLQQQPEQVRRFLLQTAILERFSSSLCDAVTRQNGSQEMLKTLEQGNLFLIPLDNKRQWYRYHHLFADVLQAHALMEGPEQIPHLHEQASQWYEQNDLFSEAIHHALAAQAFERAAGLIEQTWPTMRQRQRETTVLGWIISLPDAVIRNRPVLSVAYALVLLNDGQLDAVESRLQDAERCLEALRESTNSQKSQQASQTAESVVFESVVTDAEQLKSLPASIANARAYRAQALRDVSGTIAYAQQALDLLPEEEKYERGTTVALLGLAYWTSGRPEAGYRSFHKGLAIFKQMGLPQIAIGGTLILAQMSLAQGQLHRAISICEQSLQLAAEQGDPVLPGTPELYLALSEVHYEQGDLTAANHQLLMGETLRQQASLSGVKFLWWVMQARVKAAEGDLQTALKRLQEAENLYYRAPVPVPNVRPISALRARLWLRQGKLTEALDWVNDRNLLAEDGSAEDALAEAKPSYLKEYEYLTLARVLIAHYRRDRTENSLPQAIRLLSRLLESAESEERIGSIIEIRVVQALAYEAQGDLVRAIASLKSALTLAAPEGYVLIFAECGPPMAQLLQTALTHGIAPTYTQQLLTALETWGDPSHPPEIAIDSDPLAANGASLSPRERQVLRLLTTELSGPEIARELVVALSTVRTHTKRIYSKLNVTNRRAAVKRATELDLL